MQRDIDRFRCIFDAHNIELIIPPVKEHLSEKELLKLISNIDGVIAGDDEFTERVLKKASRLRVISKWGTGIDSINTKACKRYGCIVCNTPDAFTDAVADTVMGYILCFARQLPWMDKDMRISKWRKSPSLALHECTLGVIGVGNIGKAVLRRAIAFGMKILGNDIVEMPPEFIDETGLAMVSKKSLLKNANFVSINCNLNKTSFHLMGEKEFSIMKPQAYLINTARGRIIDEKALIEALRKKNIAGAALDVFEQEPLLKKSPLHKMQNVLLAPHNANSSPEAWERVHQNTVNNLINILTRSKS